MKASQPWRDLRPQFFDGFHRCLPALTDAGNNLIVEHIVETEAWLQRLLRLLGHLDVFFVGVHCPLPELERRELERGDKRIGEARADFETTHAFCTYDFEVLSTLPLNENVDAVIAAWKIRQRPSAFERMKHRAERTRTSGLLATQDAHRDADATRLYAGDDRRSGVGEVELIR